MNDIQKLKDYLEIELESHDVALESFLSKIFPRIGDKLREAYQSFKNYDNRKRISSNRNRFLKIVDTLDYGSVRHKVVRVPMGFVGRTVEATALLNDMIKHAETLEKEVLDPVNKYLANIINEPVKKNDAKEIFSSIFKRKEKREKMSLQMGKMYDARELSFIPLAQVLERNSDWKIILDNLEQAENFFKFDTKTLEVKTNKIINYINTIVDLINDGVIKNTQKDIIKSFSDGIFAVAEEVTFISQIFYWLSSQLEATDENMQEFIKKFG